jgi:hypothetical protein
MAEVVNLNRARKARAKAAKETTAAQNRAGFGRTKAEKELARVKEEKAARELDQKKRD